MNSKLIPEVHRCPASVEVLGSVRECNLPNWHHGQHLHRESLWDDMGDVWVEVLMYWGKEMEL